MATNQLEITSRGPENF